MLKQHGYVASFCTPHVWPQLFPDNLPEHIIAWTMRVQNQLDDAGIEYRLIPGAEVRIHPGLVDFFKSVGVPTLGDSRYVLVDYWGDDWHKCINKSCDYLLANDYVPILAHPERINVDKKYDQQIDKLTERGVLLQGNFKCLTGEEGPLADRRVREFLHQDRYTFIAMDLHRPGDIGARLEGMQMFEVEFGIEKLDRLCNRNPRQMILGLS